jgi:hypothetical protein
MNTKEITTRQGKHLLDSSVTSILGLWRAARSDRVSVQHSAQLERETQTRKRSWKQFMVMIFEQEKAVIQLAFLIAASVQ